MLMLKKIWGKIEDWTGWSKAGSIFMSRIEGIIGFVLGAAVLVDWDALRNLDWSNGWNASVAAGVGLLVLRAAVYEIVRRRGTKDF